jgi:hypothetical protein
VALWAQAKSERDAAIARAGAALREVEADRDHWKDRAEQREAWIVDGAAERGGTMGVAYGPLDQSEFCIHKILRRRCEACDLADDRDSLLAEVLAWRRGHSAGFGTRNRADAMREAIRLRDENEGRGLK